MNVLFVCVENAGRSQIAEALFTRLTAGRHSARSAGSAPADRVHGQAVEVLAETGIDLRDRSPRRLAPDDLEWADLVVTMGTNGGCPRLPGKSYVDWPVPDVGGATPEETRAVRDGIASRVIDLAIELDGYE